MSRRINVLGRPIEYDVGVIYDSSNVGKPKILEPGVDDLSRPTKAAVVRNVSDSTRGVGDPDHKNRYPVGDGLNEINLNDSSGNPVPFDSTSNTSSRTNGTGKQFVETDAEQDLLKNYSNSTVRSGRTLKNPGKIDSLKKGKQTSVDGIYDGNNLLKDGLEKIQETYISPILSNNRFTATSERGKALPTTEQGREVSQDDRSVRINPDKPPEVLGSYRNYREAAGGRDVNNGHFANIGTLLTLRATAELASSTGYGEDGPDGLGASAASLLPGTTQIGLIKVDVDDLRASEAFKSLLEDNTDPVNMNPGDSNDHLINNFGASSWGQMNNVLEPFTGILPLGMIAASTALVIAMKLALKGLTSLLSLITSAKQGNVKKDSLGRYFLGSYIHSTGPSGKFPPLPVPAKFLGLTETIHDFEDSVDKGIEQVFGAGLGNSFDRILETPGFYGVLCRNIVRSAANIVIQIQNAVKGNPIQVAQNIIEMVSVIRSSKVIAAINIMAKIGDTVLNQNDKPFQKEEIGGITKYSIIDALPDEVRVGKGRQQGKLQSALANSTTPSAFLFPKEVISAAVVHSALGGVESINPTSFAIVKNEKKLSSDTASAGEFGRKLSHGEVEILECKLDAEYIPFYFHDLRTNEIISFHAFLRSITDEFNVDTESMKAIGRIDPVKIYKSTERKIGVEFMCVATNKADFDQMWWKINKLVTLVYPQWTRGDVRKNKDVSFIQPFSQVPSASPLIRLRLGDLFRSNYSKFALARLFGLGQSDVLYNANLSSSGIEKLSEFSKVIQDGNLQEFVDLHVTVEPGTYVNLVARSIGLQISVGGKKRNVSHTELRGSVSGKIVGKWEENESFFIVRLDGFKETPDELIVPPEQINVSHVQLLKKFRGMLGGADFAALQRATNGLVEFMNEDQTKGNTIVRSFKQSSGKGLACMIDNLGFGWLDNIPWETEAYGARAPKMCNVRMSLTPIHDIAPGLDANGFNRAPIYNVGEIVNGIAGDSWDDKGQGRTRFDALHKAVRKVVK